MDSPVLKLSVGSEYGGFRGLSISVKTFSRGTIC